MTDKELRKLSRLELLEILLEETKENEKLREELEKAKSVNQNNTVLLTLIDRLNHTLNQANAVTVKLHETSENIVVAESHPQAPAMNKSDCSREDTASAKATRQMKENDKNLIMADLKLYLRILNFYLENDAALSVLPSDIQNDIRTRIRGILDAKKHKALV